jgi:hypothetical protein
MGMAPALGQSSKNDVALSGGGSSEDPVSPGRPEPEPTEPWREGWAEVPEWGGRAGYVDNGGVLWVRMQREPGSAWVDLATDVADFQLLDWRLAVRKRDGTLWFAEGPLDTPLEQVDEGVAHYQLTLTRLAILREDGAFRVLESGTTPRTVYTGLEPIVAFHATDEKVAVLDEHGTLRLHAGGAVTYLHPVAQFVTAFQLEREWLAVVEETEEGRRLLLAKGEPYGWELEFEEVAQEVLDFHMEVEVAVDEGFPSRLHLAVVNADGEVEVYEGSEPPLQLRDVYVNPAPVERVEWGGRRLYMQGSDDELWAGYLDESQELLERQSLGNVSIFRSGQEGQVLMGRSQGELGLIRARRDAQGQQVLLELDLSGEQTLTDTNVLPQKAAIGLASLRPSHVRRPVGVIPASGETPDPEDPPGNPGGGGGRE